MNDKGFFIDVMSKAQKLKYMVLVILWLCALIWFWTWWFRQDHIVTVWGLIVNSMMIAWTIFLPAYYFFFVYSMKIANPALDPPEGLYATVATKAPSGPWSVVSKTLIAMLGQKFRYKYDVWLAIETLPSDTIIYTKLSQWGSRS